MATPRQIKRADRFKLTIKLDGQLIHETFGSVGVVFPHNFELVFFTKAGIQVAERFYTDTLAHVPRKQPSGYTYSLSDPD